MYRCYVITSPVSWTLNGHVICISRRVVWMETRAAAVLKTYKANTWTFVFSDYVLNSKGSNVDVAYEDQGVRALTNNNIFLLSDKTKKIRGNDISASLTFSVVTLYKSHYSRTHLTPLTSTYS